MQKSVQNKHFVINISKSELSWKFGLLYTENVNTFPMETFESCLSLC